MTRKEPGTGRLNIRTEQLVSRGGAQRMRMQCIWMFVMSVPLIVPSLAGSSGYTSGDGQVYT
jgi:hypothetical protein